jgi:hypothetical protein
VVQLEVDFVRFYCDATKSNEFAKGHEQVNEFRIKTVPRWRHLLPLHLTAGMVFVTEFPYFALDFATLVSRKPNASDDEISTDPFCRSCKQIRSAFVAVHVEFHRAISSRAVARMRQTVAYLAGLDTRTRDSPFARPFRMTSAPASTTVLGGIPLPR